MNKDNFAFVTLATDEKYSCGALVLAHSLKLVDTQYKLVVLVTSGVSNTTRVKLAKVFDLVEDVSTLDSKDAAALALMDRPELGITLTKLHCWKLTQFEKCVFLDADTLVLKNCDELFEKSELSAVPDIGWPDCFNSGVFVLKPSIATYTNLIQMAKEKGSFDGGDQGLLNMYFSDWSTKDISNHLSFIYNMNVSSTYTYLPAYKQFGQNVKIVHFLGSLKPWMYNYNQETGSVDTHVENNALYSHLQLWWKIYTKHVAENSDQTSATAAMSNLSLTPTAKTQTPEHYSSPTADEGDRLQLWEQGRIDYMGKDSFDNIAKKLDEVINGTKK